MTDKIDRTATVHPSAHIGAQASVDPGAMVGYLATVGKGARVAEDAIVRVRGVVRAFAVLGEGSIVGPHTDIHAEAVIEDNVTIGSRVRIGRGAVVGRQCSIESHAHIEDGVRIGQRSHIGRGALIDRDAVLGQRVTVGPRAMVGAGALLSKRASVASEATVGAGARIGANARIAVRANVPHEGGAYTITISGFPSDATFDATSAAATISSAGQSVTVNFTGAYIRTASVMGTVTVENMGLPGVTVTLTGVSGATAVTDAGGQYAFTGLRMGNYTVEISGFDSDEVGFANSRATVAVGVGESKIVSFDGTYLRTAAIMGQVSVEGVGLEGVNVSLAGGPDGADMSTTTDAAGLYSFAKLRAGDYSVGISGYDTDDYEFAVTSQNVTIALGETANVPFDGILLRTSGIAGRVSVGGMGIADVTVTVSADGMDDVTAMTDATGQYAISALAAGDYTVTISGYDAVEYMFTDSQDVTLAMDATAIVNFEGTALRTASVSVSVTADGEAVAGAGVTLTMITGATSGTVFGTAATDADGAASFGPLLAGSYRVDIAVDSDEIDFESASATVMVATAEAASVSFEGTINRTGSIGGMVTVDGEGMMGVSVMLSGGGDMVADTMMTGDDGSYSFSGLRKGDYTVAIANPDEARYEFPSTSESVSLAVGQAQSVSFAGAMTRSSSISGTVSVEGSGLGGVTVTLSGDGAGTDTTDAAGGYAFTGLGAGTYMVAISGQDADAYVFETTSMEVMVGDNEAATANFSGTHARTASVSGMLFVDEGTKNDMHDEGEDPFPAAMIPVTLVGPGVDQQQITVTDTTGAFSFTGLVAGNYQLLVTVTPEVAMALGDYAYGGPATGYTIELGVGEAAMQAIPFDITHTTVHFGVTLKSGEMTGDALAGATVMLYSDAAGTDSVGAGMTVMNDDGAVASIRVARAGTTDNTVYASVSHDDYHVAEGMTTVMWDPQHTYTASGNDNDIVNLAVDLTVSGATITTEYGGGDALAGWAISVMAGDAALEGEDVPDMLDADGMASFMTTVDSAGALPMTYSFAVAEDQDDDLDGGESYEAEPVEHVHTGLSLASTVDAGTIEAKYTTQTLNVYVHHERDQAHGYTGNVVGGDMRMSGMLDLSVRYIDDAGRSRSFTAKEWNAGANTQFEDDYTLPTNAIIRGHGKAGLVVFSHLPADHNVVVGASKSDPEANIMVLDPDELAAFRNMEENGVMGGAFGAMGGFSHTVSLCPLMATDPTAQDHGECGSFAYVDTHNVFGQLWKNRVRTNPATDGFRYDERYQVPGTMFGVDPVDGKNLAGVSKSFTAAATNSRTTPWDDRKEFRFGRLAAGVYALDTPDGWRATEGGPDDDGGEDREALGGEVNLMDDLHIDVTPATGVLHGVITDSDGFAVDSATVTANGVSTTTDSKGRYILEGIEPVLGIDGRPTNTIYRNKRIIAVSVSMDKFDTGADTLMFAATVNQGTADNRHDLRIEGSANTIFITGQVTNILTSDGIGRVEIRVDGAAPLNREKRSWHMDFGKLLTAADGTYSAQISTKQRGQTASVSVVKSGYHFPVRMSPVLADGNSPAVVNFQGYENGNITGTVQGPDGSALAGVFVSAISTAEGTTAAADTMTTNSIGQFSLNVPPVSTYRIEAVLEGHVFSAPNNNWTVFAGPGQTVSFGRIESVTAGALSVSAKRVRMEDDDTTEDEDESERWTTTIEVKATADSSSVPEGYGTATYTVQHNAGGTWTDASATQTVRAADSNARTWTFTTPANADGGDGEFMVRIVAGAAYTGSATPAPPALSIESGTSTVAAIDPSATGVKARRQATATDTYGNCYRQLHPGQLERRDEWQLQLPGRCPGYGRVYGKHGMGGPGDADRNRRHRKECRLRGDHRRLRRPVECCYSLRYRRQYRRHRRGTQSGHQDRRRVAAGYRGYWG